MHHESRKQKQQANNDRNDPYDVTEDQIKTIFPREFPRKYNTGKDFRVGTKTSRTAGAQECVRLRERKVLRTF